MKIKILGKAHHKGHSNRTDRDYDFIQLHYLGSDPQVEGQAALTITVDPGLIDYASIVVGGEYIVEYGPRGRSLGVVGIRKA